MLLVGLGLFFDSFDNTLSAGVLASLLETKWSSLQLNSLFLSVTYGGLATGAALTGWVSDRFGRSFAFQFNLALFGSLALCCALAPSMPWLIAIRALMAVGMGAEYVMCFGLIVEFMPAARRGRYLGMLGIFAGAGVTLSSLVGMLVIPLLGWRAMFVIGGLGTLWLWWMRRSLPESPRWLERMGRNAEAEAILGRIELEAGVSASAGSELQARSTASPAAQTAPQWVPITVLFSRPVIRRTLMAILLNVTCLFGSYTVTGWMPTFFVSQGMSVSRSLGFNAAIMAGFVAGPLLCAFIGDRLSRRWVIVIFGVLCAVFAAIYPFLTAPGLIIGCGFLLVSAIASFLILGLGTAPEFFATAYRFRGGGVAQTAGRLGVIASPTVVLALFDGYGIGAVIGALSGMYLIVALLIATVDIESARTKSTADLEPDATPTRSS